MTGNRAEIEFKHVEPPASGIGDEDLATISRMMNSLREISSNFDAEGLRPFYTEDLHWMNAFGSRLVGREEVIRYIATLWTTPQFRSRAPVQNEWMDIWFIDADAAVVHMYHEAEGQRSLGGEAIERRTHSEKIVVRQPGGWLIRSEIFSDERDRAQRLISRTEKAGDLIRPLDAVDIASFKP